MPADDVDQIALVLVGNAGGAAAVNDDERWKAPAHVGIPEPGRSALHLRWRMRLNGIAQHPRQGAGGYFTRRRLKNMFHRIGQLSKPTAEIGRASCRERVRVPGAGGGLKKKAQKER